MLEIWKDIEGYEGKYQVSNLGNVKSLNYNNTHKEKLLVKKVNHRGYEYICFSKNNKQHYFLVHRLVAETFIPNPKNREQVNHIDGDKRNNCVENLEWCSQSENIRHAMNTGLLKIKGSNNKKSKKVQQMDLDGKILNYFDTISEAGKYLNIKGKPNGISKVCNGKRLTAYGYKWKYIY